MSTNASMTASRLQSNDGGNVIRIPSSSMENSTPASLQHLVTSAEEAFCHGLEPELCSDGSGGVYFLRDTSGNKVAIFKPADEEPYAENNPRGYLPQHVPGQPDSMRKGIAPGEACIREVAASLLDHNGFANVPMTTLVEARHPAFRVNGKHLTVAEGGAAIGSHSIQASTSSCTTSTTTTTTPKKVGSFQEFVDCECIMDDISYSKIPAGEVHKIASLDIRLMNSDRHGGNLLCRKLAHNNSYELVPIDHGYCLRSACDVSSIEWCWFDWPQLKQPISMEHKQYIENLDIESDVRILGERLNIGQEALDLFRASSALLVAGVKNGMTLYEIAVLCCRTDDRFKEPSLLERLTGMAPELAQTAVQNDHTTVSRALIEQLLSSGTMIGVLHQLLEVCASASNTEGTKVGALFARFESNTRTMLERVTAQDDGTVAAVSPTGLPMKAQKFASLKSDDCGADSEQSKLSCGSKPGEFQVGDVATNETNDSELSSLV